MRQEIRQKTILVPNKIIDHTVVCTLCFLAWWVLNAACKKSERAPASDKRYEVPFKKEGRLAFIKKDTNDTLIVIDIEIADNEEERTRGLMWRYSMPDGDGMLFVFGEESPLSFWMKNTYIPLDIVFVNKRYEIITIRQNTTPLDEMPIPSDKPAQYVVEVNAWFCARRRIKTGDGIGYVKVK